MARYKDGSKQIVIRPKMVYEYNEFVHGVNLFWSTIIQLIENLSDTEYAYLFIFFKQVFSMPLIFLPGRKVKSNTH